MGILTLRRWGLWIFVSLADVSLSVRDIYDNIKMSWWALVTTGYLDPNGYKKGNGKATSQIELRSQNGQTEQRSCANSTLNITNGVAVSHHYSYMIDRLRRRYWVRIWLSQAEREEEGQYTRLMPMF